MEKSGFSIRQFEIPAAQNDSDFEEKSGVYPVCAFRLIHFKAFRDTGWIKINHLTLLLGENSSGKSALYQGLLMVSEAYQYLMQEEKFVNLAKISQEIGNFDDICRKSETERIVKIGFQFLQNEKKLEYWVSIAPNEKDKFGKVVNVLGIQQELSINFLSYYESVNLFFLERKKDLKIPGEVIMLASTLLTSLRAFAQSLQIIAAHRYQPERFMQLTGSSSGHMSASGSNTYDMLYALTEIQGKDIPMVESWLNKFGYSYSWKMSGVNRGQFMLRELKTGIESNLVDNGFGISQSLPLALALDTLAGKTLLLDSPEAFLQTRMQSEMGDLLVDGSKNGNILVETGSEYLTLRIRRRVAEGVISKEEISIYYLKETEKKETVCMKIMLDENGEIQDMPESFAHFFSSDFLDIERLDEIRRNRRRYAKENRH